MFDDPIVVFVEETENGSEVLGLLLQKLVEDVELGPHNFFVTVKIISLKELFFDFCLVEVLQMFGVGGSLDVSCTFLDHLEHYIKRPLPNLGVRNSESSLRSALLPYSLNSFMSFFPSYSGQALKSFISLRVMIPSSSLSIILRKDFVKFSSPE